MVNLVLFLVFRDSSDFLGSQEHVLVDRCEDPTYSLKRERFCDHVDLRLIGVVKRLNSIDLSDLLRLINGFNVNSHSLGVIGIF